jgi:hypothetical protein
MDVHIAKSKYGLKDSGGMSIYFLDSIEATFSDSPWERRKLFDTDNSWIGNDEEVEFIIDPIQEDKCQKGDPVDSYPSPIDRLVSNDFYNRKFIIEEYPRRQHKGQ